MQHSLAFLILCMFGTQYCYSGFSMEPSNLFIYPQDYVKADAPLYNHSGEMICIVNVNMEVWAINQISLQTQDLEVDLTINVRWTDYRLTVNRNLSSHWNWSVIDRNEAKKIWMPVLLFRNCKGCIPLNLIHGEDLYINRTTGVMVGQLRLLQKFSCAIDLQAYPMDIQFCNIQIYMYEDTEEVIILQHLYPDEGVVHVSSNITLAEYRVFPLIKSKCVYKDAESYEYSCLELRIRLEHLVAYHLITSYAPTSFIVILSWISFWLPLELAPARVALGLTSLLTLATRLDQAQKNLPPVAYAKAIDIWMFACIFLVSASLCEFAFAHYRQELYKKKTKVESRKIKVRSAALKKNNKRPCSAIVPAPKTNCQRVSQNETSFDCISRVLFPVAFIFFNVGYWSYYLTYYD